MWILPRPYCIPLNIIYLLTRLNRIHEWFSMNINDQHTNQDPMYNSFLNLHFKKRKRGAIALLNTRFVLIIKNIYITDVFWCYFVTINIIIIVVLFMFKKIHKYNINSKGVQNYKSKKKYIFVTIIFIRENRQSRYVSFR